MWFDDMEEFFFTHSDGVIGSTALHKRFWKPFFFSCLVVDGDKGLPCVLEVQGDLLARAIRSLHDLF